MDKNLSSHPTIGLLINNFLGVGKYQTNLWAGIDEATRERDANLICFPGGSLGSVPANEFEYQHNVIFDLATPESVDGVLIAGPAMGSFVSHAELIDFYQRYHPLPTVSISLEVEGIPSVVVDNDEGLRDGIIHLIDEHGARRIAFIPGPAVNPEAEERYQVYKRTLAEREIPFDPDLVAPEGLFDLPSGERAIRALFDERGLFPDAIVAADDVMAIGAMETLRERGIETPYDVTVLGFNDAEETQSTLPPLTTVRQPIQEMGRRAAQLLLDLIAGQEVPQRVALPTELVVRRSCGCYYRSQEPSTIKRPVAEESTSDLAPVRQRLLAEVANHRDVLGDQRYARWKRLLEVFLTDLDGTTSNTFLATLDRTLRQTAASEAMMDQWRDILFALHRHLIAALAGHRLDRALDLWQEALMLTEEARQQTYHRQLLQAEKTADTLREITQALNTAFDVATLIKVVGYELPRLGIDGCYIALYEETSATSDSADPLPRQAYLTMACDETGPIDSQVEGRRFLTRQLIPPELLPQEERYHLLVRSLFFRENRFGFVVYRVGPLEGAVYEMLQVQMSGALKNAQLFRQVEAHARQLETAARVAHAASSTLDREKLLQQVVSLVRKRFDLDYAGLFLIDEEEEYAVLQASAGPAEGRSERPRVRIGDGSIVSRCIVDQTACLADEETLQLEGAAELALPLISRGTMIGALSIRGQQTLTAFDEGQVTAFQTLADLLANAIENARLYEALAREQYLMQALMDTLPDYIYFKDRESRFIRNSQSHAEFFGLDDPEELIGKDDFDFLSPADAQHAYDDEQRIMETGQPLMNAEERAKTLSGKEQWVLTSKLPLRDEKGEIVGTFGITKDITELKEYQAKLERLVAMLEKRATQLRTGAEVAQAASSILDPDELVQRVVDLLQERFNLYYVGLFLVEGSWAVLRSGTGQAGRQMIDQGHRLKVGGNSMIGWCIANEEARIALDVGEDAVHFDNPFLPETHSELALPLLSRGEPIGALSIQSQEKAAFTKEDIALFQTMAGQLANAIANARLYRKAQNELIERQRAEQALAEQAKALDAELEQFFFVASHHLQEPLRMVVSYTQLLQRRYADQVDEEANEIIAYAVRGANRIRALINDVLSYARVTTRGKAPNPTELSTIVDRALSNLSTALEQVDAKLHVPQSLPTVMADAAQLTQVFQHLLINAIQYRRDEQPLEIRIDVEHPDEDRVQVAVADNGKGIAAEYHDRVFELFQRLHNEGNGTGIGLALCKKIIERHGGEIWLESEPDGGSTFLFTLPSPPKEEDEQNERRIL